MSLLPDLNLHTTTNDTNTHGGQKVVGGVGVVVDTTVEHGCGILANTGVDHSLSTWVVLDERGDVMYDTSNADKSAAVLGLVNVVVPLHDRERIDGGTPIKPAALLVDLLLLLLNATLFDLVAAELLEVGGEAKLLPGPDRPLGWVVLVPLDGVAVVRWELVVEVVVTLAESDESGDQVVTWRVAVVKWLVTEPVSERVDTESSLLDEEDSEDTGVDEATEPVTPAETSDESWEDQTHEDDDLEVVTVLPDDDWVLVQVRNIRATNSLWVLLHEHPAEVGVKKTLAD